MPAKKKRSKKMKNKQNLVQVLSISAMVVLVILALIISSPKILKSSYIAAEVNGRPIYTADIERQYNALPDSLKAQTNKSKILQNSIDVILLKQEAESRGIVLSDEQFNSLLEQALEQSNTTKEELESKLKKSGMTLSDIKTQFVIRTLLNGLLVDVSEEKQQETVQEFVNNLRSKANIIIYMK